jgi:DNA repair exonuclease SbcCD ATPase subunit
MARPLPANSAPPRNGTHSTIANLAANLALAASDGERIPEPPGSDGAATSASNPIAEDNLVLHERLAELEHQLAELKKAAEQTLHEQQTEFEGILEEKTELLRELHHKVQELEARTPRPVCTPREEELMTLSEELERERQQLKEDEESLMQQMGHMEVQMSRERAELARQRTELQRLQSEIRHELELAARDSALRERLAPLQRRQQELCGRAKPSATPVAVPAADGASNGAPRSGGSGLLRRLFG